MFGFLRQHPKAFGASLLLHLLIIVLAGFSLSSRDAQQLVKKPGPLTQTIQTEIVDEKALVKRAQKQSEIERRRQLEQKRKAEAARKKAEAERKRKAEQARKKAEAEKKHKAEQARKQAEAEKKRKAEAARRKAEAEKKRKAEVARKKAEAEKKRKAEEARRKAEAERKRKAEEARKKAEAERKRKAAEEAARRKAEEEQRRKEAELQARLAAEERQRELDRLRNTYYAMIRDKISRNWRRPPNAGDTPACEVRVEQAPGGMVVKVVVGDCPGTPAYRLSVDQAVRKADPLPEPPDPELFEREIRLIFKPR